jgi:hypothetical protein
MSDTAVMPGTDSGAAKRQVTNEKNRYETNTSGEPILWNGRRYVRRGGYFYKSDKVTAQKVTFKNQYNMMLLGIFSFPKV